MAAKDENELKLIRLASSITQEVYSKVFKDHIKNIINDDRVRVHCSLLQSGSKLFTFVSRGSHVYNLAKTVMYLWQMFSINILIDMFLSVQPHSLVFSSNLNFKLI